MTAAKSLLILVSEPESGRGVEAVTLLPGAPAVTALIVRDAAGSVSETVRPDTVVVPSIFLATVNWSVLITGV